MFIIRMAKLTHRNRHKRTVKMNRKLILLAAAVLVIAAGVLVVLERKGITNLYTRNSNSNGESDDPNKINYDPPTKEEQSAGDKKKEEIVEQEQKPQETTPPATAQLTVTDARQYDGVVEVTSHIGNVYEDGICTFKFEQGSHVITKSTTAFRDVSTTICTNPLVPRSEFPAAGDWGLTVSYKSASGITGSAKRTVTIR